MKTAEEFIREKIREKNSFPEKYVMEGLQNYTVTGQDCLRWAHEFANQDKWIKLSEHRPVVGKKVLVICNKTVQTAVLTDKEKEWYFFELEWRLSEDCNKITHWQPLPQFLK